MYDIEKLNNKKVSELREIADELNIQKSDKLKKQELVYKILDEQALKPSSESADKEKLKKPRNNNRKPQPEKFKDASDNSNTTKRPNNQDREVINNDRNNNRNDRNNNRNDRNNNRNDRSNEKNNKREDYEYDFKGIVIS